MIWVDIPAWPAGVEIRNVRFLAFILVGVLLALPARAEQATLGAQPAGASADLAATPLTADDVRLLLSSGALSLLRIDDEKLALLNRSYASRGYAPLWLDATGLNAAGTALLRRLRQIAAAGQPSVAALIGEVANRVRSHGGRPLAELELLLSTGLAVAAIDPDDPTSLAEQPGVLPDIATVEEPLSRLRDLLPAEPAFWRLRAGFQAYRTIEASGGWPIVPVGPKLELGDDDLRVEALRRRLLVTGDLAEIGPQPKHFDVAVDAAVRRFQARHGLAEDGIVGRNTLAALNVTVQERLAIIDLNLRRLQHREWGERYLVVNAAAASYRLVHRGQQVFERVAIVGRRDWPTPQLSSVIDRLEFNPYWVVPPRITRLEVLPKIQRDPDYMRRNDMHWINGQIVQNPGPKNPLGKVKFLFANPYSVYLHDTNSPQLFERWNRFLSHGCMRVSEALDLATYLLADDPAWPDARIEQVPQSGRNVQIHLATPIPLHVVYDTAWVDEAGIVNFRQDVYGRDRFPGAAVAEAAGDEQQRCRG
jgi:murein L,D-transpeptidase YcbB/YkuD